MTAVKDARLKPNKIGHTSQVHPANRQRESSRKEPPQAFKLGAMDSPLRSRTLPDCIGNTPMVALTRLPGIGSNRLFAKLEGNNPAGSVEDRPAYSMIRRAAERGEIKPGDTLIEATSGNTGIALAMAAAMMGFRMVLIM